MASITDDRGYNQGFAPAKSTQVRLERRASLILSQMLIRKDTRILEIGCGTGELSYSIAKHSEATVLGTDLCVPFIDEAKEKYRLPNLTYAVMDVNDPTSFQAQQFEYIIGNGILHHLYQTLDSALLSMKDLLKENGKLIFFEPNYYNPYVYSIFSYPKLRKLANLEPSEMAFSKRFIERRLSNAGFTDIAVAYKDFLLPGIPAFLIRPSILIGEVLEKIPLCKLLSQSLFIQARKK